METKIATVNISQEEYSDLWECAFRFKCIMRDFRGYQASVAAIDCDDIARDTKEIQKEAAIDDLIWKINFEIQQWEEKRHDN